MTGDNIAREARLRRSLKRLGYELVATDANQFYIRHEGRRIHATSDLFEGLDQGARRGGQGEASVIDTTQVATEIRHLIVAGMPEGELLVRVARKFPDLTLAELSAALQDATAAAERQASRRH